MNIIKNINLLSLQNMLTHIKLSIIPLVELFRLVDKVKSSIEMQYKNIHLNKWTDITLLKNSGLKYLIIEMLPEGIHSRILKHLQLVY